MADASLLALASPTTAATFVAADPPRDSWLAVWATEGDGRHLQPDTELVLATPAGTQVRRRSVAVRRIDLADALDELVDWPGGAPAGRSVAAWVAAARIAVELVARGRLMPGLTATGLDTWRLGPLDPDDHQRRADLARALPPEAHAVATPGRGRVRMTSPDATVTAFCDAVADLLPRTASGPAAAGSDLFAARSPVTPLRAITDTAPAAARWLATLAPSAEAAVVGLRLQPPIDEDDPFRAVLQLQSATDTSLVIDAADLWAAPDVVMRRFPDGETDLLLALRRGARTWSPLTRLLDDARPAELAMTDDEADDLLGPVVDDLAGAGLHVLWPKELVDSLTLRAVVVSTPAPAAVAATGFSLEDLLELRWSASLGGEELTPDELALLAAAKRPVVRLRGRWVRADPDRLARLRQRRRLNAGEVLAATLGGELVVDGEALDVAVEGPFAALTTRLAAFDPGRRSGPPPGLTAELRPYQERGLAWLVEMAELGLGGVLADDMGLGKTIQLLALHLQRRADGAEHEHGPRPTLVICPASVLANWEREAARFAPDVPVRRYHGTGRTLDDLAGDEIVVATYGMVRRDADALAAVGWGLIAADEAQAVKNPLSRTAKALRRLPADARFALTGTPVENRLTELWALLDWTTPGLLGPLETFRRQVALPIERYRDPEVTETLARVTRPFLLRRRKSDPTIVPELPAKTEIDRVVPLSVEQASLYRAVTDEALATIAESEGIERRGLVLKLLTALKQICNHPAQYLHQPGHASRSDGPLGPLAERSGKLDAASELLDIVASEGAAALVFTQYVAMGRLLEQHLGAQGLRTEFLHGSLGIRKRQEMVDRFQAGEADAFVISLKAGGTGLNLTQASHVVHYDRWWNPAVEDQASDRAWRIGQDKPVTVHRLICEGTIEDRIAALLTQKRELADAVVGSGEGWITELDDRGLADLVRLAQPEAGGTVGDGGPD